MQSIKYTHIFAHMNTISSHLQRFSNKRPHWARALIGGGRYIEGGAYKTFSFPGGGGGRLKEGALKRGWALNRGFTVRKIYKRCDYINQFEQLNQKLKN